MCCEGWAPGVVHLLVELLLEPLRDGMVLEAACAVHYDGVDALVYRQKLLDALHEAVQVAEEVALELAEVLHQAPDRRPVAMLAANAVPRLLALLWHSCKAALVEDLVVASDALRRGCRELGHYLSVVGGSACEDVCVHHQLHDLKVLLICALVLLQRAQQGEGDGEIVQAHSRRGMETLPRSTALTPAVW